ncbi:MAG TPA: WD40 repeat domain-containing protein [Candidatus Limnocylindria bacterium]|nr:WD40 repeat domain-containing protein [Candidatus Limnocylindria bacterium]
MSGSAAKAQSVDWSLALKDPVVSLSWAPDGGSLAAITGEGRLVIVNAATGAVLHDVVAHEGGGFKVGWNPKEAILASTGQDGQVRLWSPVTGQQVESYPAGAAWGEQLAWSPTGDWLATAAGKQLKFWAPGRGVVHTFKEHPSTLTSLAWKSDGAMLAVSYYGAVRFYDPNSGGAAKTLPWKTSLISVSWSPDSRWVVAGTQELSVQIWEMPFRPGEELAMSGYHTKVRELAWHSNSRFLATGGGNEAMVWNCGGGGPAGTTPRILEGHSAKITALDYQPVGHLLASGGADSMVYFWNAGKSSSPLGQTRMNGALEVVKWSPTQSKVAVGTLDGTLAVITGPNV